MDDMSQSQSRSQRRRGRPPAEEPGSTVCAWVSVSEHDQLVEIARERGESVSSVARKLLRMGLRRSQG